MALDSINRIWFMLVCFVLSAMTFVLREEMPPSLYFERDLSDCQHMHMRIELFGILENIFGTVWHSPFF